MITSIIPLKTIILQTFFLLVAIAIEGAFLYEFLKFSRKTSLDYAIPMNLFSTITSWLMFFTFVPWIGQPLQTDLMDYIFFNQVSDSLYYSLILSVAPLFIIRLLLKILVFIFIEKLKNKFWTYKVKIHQKNQLIFTKKIKPKRKTRVVLWGHSCSDTILLLILFLINWNPQ